MGRQHLSEAFLAGHVRQLCALGGPDHDKALPAGALRTGVQAI